MFPGWCLCFEFMSALLVGVWKRIHHVKELELMHRHTQPFYGPLSGTIRVSQYQKKRLGFILQGKITKADTLTVQLCTSPSGLISNALSSSPILTPDALTECL